MTTVRRCRHLEQTTPRVDSEGTCRCGAGLVFDEVFGWMHSNPAGGCQRPAPAGEQDPQVLPA